MRNKVEKVVREGEYWSEEECHYLQSLLDSGTDITAIAILLQHTEPAVIMQANQMDPQQKAHMPPQSPPLLMPQLQA